MTDDEMRQIVDGLSGILDDIENGRLAFSDAYEDIHSFVEANLIDRIGDAGKKLHTGRSRNDQVALDMKMYIRDEIGEISGLLRHFLQTLLSVMEENSFDGPCRNSMDGVSDRDYLIEFLDALAICQMHLSRFSEEIIIWNSNEYRFVELDDAYSTGSSIMPQKKNPDIAELVRGKTGRVYAALVSLLTTMKGIPLAYDKDMQEDKELTFDAIDTLKIEIPLFDDMIRTCQFRPDVMEASAKHGFTNATDAADYLVEKGVPFRDAHGIIGRMVLYCIDHKKALDDLSLEEFRQFSDRFGADIYEAISLRTCVEKRLTEGAPSARSMDREIAACRAYLSEETDGSLED